MTCFHCKMLHALRFSIHNQDEKHPPAIRSAKLASFLTRGGNPFPVKLSVGAAPLPSPIQLGSSLWWETAEGNSGELFGCRLLNPSKEFSFLQHRRNFSCTATTRQKPSSGLSTHNNLVGMSSIAHICNSQYIVLASLHSPG